MEQRVLWTVLLATRMGEGGGGGGGVNLGFSCLRAWPRVDEPGVFRRHLWGRRLDCSDDSHVILVLAHSPVAQVNQTNCAGFPFFLPGVDKSIEGEIHCLMPGCRHANITRTTAKSLNWPLCAVEEIRRSRYYPATDSAVLSALWVGFDVPSILPGLRASETEDAVALRDRIGDLPLLIANNLLPKTSKTPPTAPSVTSPKGSWFSWVCSHSYILCLLTQHPCRSKVAVSTPAVVLLALQLLLLVTMVATSYFPIYSTNICRVYGDSLNQLVALARTLRSKNTTWSGVCLLPNPLSTTHATLRRCIAVEGPSQQTATEVFGSFLAVGAGATRHGCVFEVVAASTDAFAGELRRFLVWLASSEPAGWKINRNIATLMARFFISHVVAWQVYVHSLIRVARDVGETLRVFFICSKGWLGTWMVVLMSGGLLILLRGRKTVDLLTAALRMAASIVICALLDLIGVATLHLTCFYVYTVRLFRVQLLGVVASWRLCRSGSKWNPLRKRVDTIPQNDDYPPMVANAVRVPPGASEADVRRLRESQGEAAKVAALRCAASQSRHLDRVFVATFLGVATGLCLLPTTLAFYAAFSLIFIGLVIVKGVLVRLVYLILSFPLEAFIRWVFDCTSTHDTLVIVAPNLDSIRVPFLTLELVRGSLSKLIRRNALFDTKNLFGRPKSFGEVLKCLICAKLLYPISESD